MKRNSCIIYALVVVPSKCACVFIMCARACVYVRAYVFECAVSMGLYVLARVCMYVCVCAQCACMYVRACACVCACEYTRALEC